MVVLAGSFGSFACVSGDRWRKSAEVHRDDRVLVQRETRSGSSFAHPVTLDAESLAKDLCALRYIDKWAVTRNDEAHPPWSCEDAGQVGRAIAAGLAAADENERVRFWVRWRERDIGAPWYVPDERHTRGIAFLNADRQLELDFDWVHRVQGESSRAARSPDERSSRRVRLVPPPGVELVESDGKRQPMRLIWPMSGEARRDRVEPDVDPAVRARLELLEEMHRAGDIDDATYERRKREISSSS